MILSYFYVEYGVAYFPCIAYSLIVEHWDILQDEENIDDVFSRLQESCSKELDDRKFSLVKKFSKIFLKNFFKKLIQIFF